jgi:hypothetical protein
MSLSISLSHSHQIRCFNLKSYFYYFLLLSSFSLISCLFRFLLLISNLQASHVASGINVSLTHALDCALNAIIPSELPFLDGEAIVAEIVSMAVLIQVSLKLSASFREIFIAIMIICMNL